MMGQRKEGNSELEESKGNETECIYNLFGHCNNFGVARMWDSHEGVARHKTGKTSR